MNQRKLLVTRSILLCVLFGLMSLNVHGQVVKKIPIRKGDRFLNFPIKRSNELQKARVKMGDKVLDEFTLKLADEDPDFWTFFDVSPYQGKTITFEVDNEQAGSDLLDQIYADKSFPGEDSLYHETYRQQIHFSSRRGWNNDPNGLIYYQGQYHMFYQHNPYGWDWGNMHWGHAVSNDLIHWKELPDALYSPNHDHMAFSGSAAWDTLNTGGFSRNGIDPLIAAYTRTGSGEHLALSYDNGQTFEEFEGNPVIKHQGRDPQLFWYEPGKHWVMVVYDESETRQIGLGQQAKNFQNAIYTSPDLRHWTYQSAVPGFFECPELFEIPVEGTKQKKWVMYDGDGTYVVGEFDGKTFNIEQSLRQYDYGGNFYASQLFDNVPDGRHIQIGWFRGLVTEGMPFNQGMTFPTRLTLRQTSDGYRLCPTPIREIKQLFEDGQTVENQVIKADKGFEAQVKNDRLYVVAEFEQGDAYQFGLNINGHTLTYDHLNGKFNGTHYVVPNDKPVKIEAIVDKMSMEVFVNDGELYYVFPYNSVNADKKVEVFAKGHTQYKVILKKLEVHPLKSIWQ